jgi:hypothetical protein
MNNLKKRVIPKTCVLAGVCLLVVGALVLFFWQRNIYFSMQKAEDYVQTLRDLIPAPQAAVPEERKDNTMPILSVRGTDFVGILEMPRYELTLPVCADWGYITKYPCQFNGSVYNRTMQIGATSQKGQYDFYREISVGDLISFTDMEGNCYTYEVTNLHYEKHADQNTLEREESALTLFIKNVYDFEYLIISCNVLN